MGGGALVPRGVCRVAGEALQPRQGLLCLLFACGDCGIILSVDRVNLCLVVRQHGLCLERESKSMFEAGFQFLGRHFDNLEKSVSPYHVRTARHAIM